MNLFTISRSALLRSCITLSRGYSLIWPPLAGLKSEFQFHVGILKTRGPEDVTALSIVESAAFYMQKRHHWAGLTPHEYQDLLVGELPDYQVAYLVAEKILGAEDAFKVFPLFAEMALWTAAPQDTFVPLCNRFAILTFPFADVRCDR